MSNENETPLVEALRKVLPAEVSYGHHDRKFLSNRYGQLWNTQELANEFVVHSYSTPFVVVTRKHDNAVGSLMFQHNPRWYFMFEVYDGDEPLTGLRGAS